MQTLSGLALQVVHVSIERQDHRLRLKKSRKSLHAQISELSPAVHTIIFLLLLGGTMCPVRLLFHIGERRPRTLLANGITHSQTTSELLFLIASSLLGLENIVLSRSGTLSPPRSENLLYALIPQAEVFQNGNSYLAGVPSR